MNEKNLEQMKTGDLAERARQAGITNVDQMNKDEMIQALGGGPKRSEKPGRGGGQGDAPRPKGTDPSEWKNIPGNQS